MHAAASSPGPQTPQAYDTEFTLQLEKLKELAPAMLDEWDRTKKPPRQAAWVHEKEFS